jgi:hypothetical protein
VVFTATLQVTCAPLIQNIREERHLQLLGGVLRGTLPLLWLCACVGVVGSGPVDQVGNDNGLEDGGKSNVGDGGSNDPSQTVGTTCYSSADCGQHERCAVAGFEKPSENDVGECADDFQAVGHCPGDGALSDNERENGIQCKFLTAPCTGDRRDGDQGEGERCRRFLEYAFKVAPPSAAQCSADSECSNDMNCSLGKCTRATLRGEDELWAMYYINQFRTSPEPIPQCCNHEGPAPACDGAEVFPDPGALPPSRLNADMVRSARMFAQNVVDWRAETEKGFCGHQDPIDHTAIYRRGAYLAEVGLQNAWCGYVGPESAPITGDPWHCGAMLARDGNEWGLGHAEGHGGYQVQDIGTDHAYLTAVINNEAPVTDSAQVQVYVLPEGIFRPSSTYLANISEVQLSESPCFNGASWQPWQPLIPHTLSSGPGRKVLYIRARDENGATFVTWDSIHLGTPAGELDSLDEAISRIREVRLPPLGREGYDQFAYSLGGYHEGEGTPVWWGYRNDVVDPDAYGGKALELFNPVQPSGGTRVGLTNIQNGPRDIPVGDSELWMRVSVPDASSENQAARLSWREDQNGDSGSTVARGVDLSGGGYQWMRAPVHRVHPWSIFYVEIELYQVGARLDRYEIWSAPISTKDAADGTILDFSHRDYRGMEIQIRYINSKTGAWTDGERINPNCPGG